MPEEARKRVAEALSGKKLTPEHRANISTALRGRNFSPEHRVNLSKARAGKKLSPEHLVNMSKARIGKKLSPEHLAVLREKMYDLREYHPRSRWWFIRSPNGVTFRFINLSEFVETHQELFDEDDSANNKGRGRSKACRGLRSLSPRQKEPRNSWKGWTWVFSPELEQHLYETNCKK